MKEGDFFYARWPLVTQFKNVPREGEAKSKGWSNGRANSGNQGEINEINNLRA